MQAEGARTDGSGKFRLHALGLGRVAMNPLPAACCHYFGVLSLLWRVTLGLPLAAWACDPRGCPLQLGRATPGLPLAAWACDPRVAPRSLGV